MPTRRVNAATLAVMSPAEVHIRFDSPTENQWVIPPSVPTRVLSADAHGLTRLTDHEKILKQWADPLEALRWLEVEARQTPAACWAGFISYDMASWFEPSLSFRHRSDFPMFAFGEVTSGTAEENLDASQSSRRGELSSNFTRAGYESAVARAIEYVRAGDIFQVNLSQRLFIPVPADLPAVYRRLRPARYGAYLKFGDLTLLSSSPELFLSVTPDRTVLTRPIKGTRPAGTGMDVELRDSVKDQAELNMIVDLERNDLGRVCEIGSVRVCEPRSIEHHPTVLHGVAGITGKLRNDVDFVDLLRATFPGGSVTGAPKVRAMQIIDELEPCARGPYCGAIGYLAGDGSMQFNVAIRTMISHGGTIEIPVGGGIVADSNPAAEFEETMVKARAMLGALGLKEPRTK